MGTRVSRVFWGGMVLVAPLALTVYVLYSLFSVLSGVYPMLGQPLAGLAGAATVVASIFVVGLLSRSAASGLINYFDGLAGHVPGLGMIYRGTKDLIKAVGGEQSQFKHPVSVEMFKGSQIRWLGFITRDDLGSLAGKGDVAVYVPQTYGVAGFVVVAPKSRVRALDVRAQDLLQFVLTGGLSGDIQAPAKRKRAK